MVHLLNIQPSILQNYLLEIRDINIQTDQIRFRHNLNRIGELMGYEISKLMTYESIEVQTSMGIASCNKLTSPIVLGAILRAALPLHQGLLNVFSEAENAFISAYRKHDKEGSFDIHTEYITCPNINDKILILADPMLATGASIDATLKSLLEFGKPKEIHIVVVIASTYGIDFITRLYPDVHLWVGAQDEELTAKSYIVPGLGDAGDLAYGSKLQM